MILLLCSAAAATCGVLRYRESDRIRINEVCTSNLTCYINEEGTAPDWIELYNEGEKDVDLSGYVLSKTNGDKNAFTLPQVVLKGGDYLIIPMGEQTENYFDPEASFSLSSFLLTGKAIPEEKKLVTNFRLSAEGDHLFLFDRVGTRIDYVEIPPLYADTSYARTDEGFMISEPTPGEKNSGRKADIPTLEKPRFSIEGGFYNEPVTLSLYGPQGVSIYYTTDGSDPTPDSTLYTGPIRLTDVSGEENKLSARTDVSPGFELSLFSIPKDPVPKANVVRAACFDENGAFSETETASYFIGYDGKEGFVSYPVVSLVTDPDNFFGDENGIYVLGKEYEKYRKELEEGKAEEADPWVWIPANYLQRGQLYEREVHIEYFDTNRVHSASQSAGARIKGNSSRSLAQKSLNLYARAAYGKDHFDPPMTLGSLSRHSLTLYSGAQDMDLKIQDMLGAELLSDKDVAVLSEKPCQVFLNGEYWGLYLITERYDAAFLNEHFGIPEDEAVIIKAEELVAGTQADLLEYEKLKDFVRNSDFSKEENYRQFQELVDIDSFLNYYCAEIFFGHETDWPVYNSACFKSRTRSGDGGKYRDGRWRYMLYDVNGLMNLENVSSNTVVSALQLDFVLPKLMENRSFRSDFLNRMRSFIEEDLAEERIDPLIESLAARVRPGITVYYERYFSEQGKDLAWFEKETEELKQFFHERGSYVLSYLQEVCE